MLLGLNKLFFIQLSQILQIKKELFDNLKNVTLFFRFLIYLPDSQKSIEGTIHSATVKQSPRLASGDAEIFLFS